MCAVACPLRRPWPSPSGGCAGPGGGAAAGPGLSSGRAVTASPRGAGRGPRRASRALVGCGNVGPLWGGGWSLRAAGDPSLRGGGRELRGVWDSGARERSGAKSEPHCSAGAEESRPLSAGRVGQPGGRREARARRCGVCRVLASVRKSLAGEWAFLKAGAGSP